ncbi:winged helix-turn-helix domain-containing protein [Mesorhizobium sp. M0802]|uniref:winged helix-turn-helix domain-containing protein n=1 Tax=Mesorhizobium sp. M0802 TaxID=2957001 RepID=UPI00333B8E14
MKTISSRDHYMIVVLDALRALGGRALSNDVYAWLQENGHAREDDLKIIQSDGGTRFRKEVRFARKELYDAGLVTMEGYGDWGLSDVGASTFLTPAGARAIAGMRNNSSEISLAQPNSGSVINPRPTTGPIPTAWTATVSRRIDGVAWTYVSRFGETNLWKIGQADDIRARIDEINRHLPVEIYPEKWGAFRSHPWSDTRSAYVMEQVILNSLGAHRSQGERVMCREDQIRAAWDQSVLRLS